MQGQSHGGILGASLPEELVTAFNRASNNEEYIASLRAENAEWKKDYAQAASFMQDMALQTQDLMSQLATRDWQPISNPPKEEDWTQVGQCKLLLGLTHQGALLLFVPQHLHLAGVRYSHWCRIPALPKAEDKPHVCDHGCWKEEG